MKSKKEIQTIWEYKVKSEFVTQFQSAYEPTGDWAILFQKCPGYIKTELKRDIENPNRYLTIDYWQSYSQFSEMKNIVATEYRLLDKLCEGYTESENHIGIFEVVGSV